MLCCSFLKIDKYGELLRFRFMMFSGSFWCIGLDLGNVSIMRWLLFFLNEFGFEFWYIIRLWGNFCNWYVVLIWLLVLFFGLLEVLWVIYEIRIWLWILVDFNGDEYSVKIMVNFWIWVWLFVLLVNLDKIGDWWG